MAYFPRFIFFAKHQQFQAELAKVVAEAACEAGIYIYIFFLVEMDMMYPQLGMGLRMLTIFGCNWAMNYF